MFLKLLCYHHKSFENGHFHPFFLLVSLFLDSPAPILKSNKITHLSSRYILIGIRIPWSNRSGSWASLINWRTRSCWEKRHSFHPAWKILILMLRYTSRSGHFIIYRIFRMIGHAILGWAAWGYRSDSACTTPPSTEEAVDHHSNSNNNNASNRG